MNYCDSQHKDDKRGHDITNVMLPVQLSRGVATADGARHAIGRRSTNSVDLAVIKGAVQAQLAQASLLQHVCKIAVGIQMGCRANVDMSTAAAAGFVRGADT